MIQALHRHISRIACAALGPIARSGLSISLGIAALAVFTGGCGARTGRETREILSLKEMSREQRMVFLKGYRGDWRDSVDKNRGIPPPPIEKPWPAGAELVSLPDPFEAPAADVALVEAVRNRRSRRAYTAEGLTLAELSWLLWCTQGIEKIERNDDGNVVATYRPVPSGGARHPFETYLSVHRVEGLKAGIYRYLPVEHKLLPLRYDANMASDFKSACYNQEHVGRAAVLFIWAAVPCRTEWAYGIIAPKLIAVDAGHVCQNLYLGAEAIRVGVCGILGYDQQRLDSLLCLDGRNEFVIYLASVGRTSTGGPDSQAGGALTHETVRP
jgi:SagB-type dehydrogenase family enzyme